MRVALDPLTLVPPTQARIETQLRLKNDSWWLAELMNNQDGRETVRVQLSVLIAYHHALGMLTCRSCSHAPAP